MRCEELSGSCCDRNSLAALDHFDFSDAQRCAWLRVSSCTLHSYISFDSLISTPSSSTLHPCHRQHNDALAQLFMTSIKGSTWMCRLRGKSDV
jgi:hypothetical protein